ncbi:hypothetical protein HWV62_45262 [Athelia sp. TMB]|nr:hypothetical protein HWV62_45262 [Athelia sp. TMB]
MFSSTLVVLALSASAFADIYVTSPVATSNFVGGQPCTVSWQEDNTVPLLAAFGPATVAIYAGNSQQQTLLQTITPSVDVSTTQALVFTPDPSIGPDADEYFIRFQSLALTTSTTPAYPALAFSAKFTMSGMSGTFNSSVQAEIDGQSTAPIGGTAAAASTSGAAAATASGFTTATSSSASVAGGAAKTTGASGSASTGTANGAVKVTGAGMAALMGAMTAIFATVW